MILRDSMEDGRRNEDTFEQRVRVSHGHNLLFGDVGGSAETGTTRTSPNPDRQREKSVHRERGRR